MKILIKLLIILQLSFISYAKEVDEIRYGFLESTLTSSFAFGDAKVAAKAWLEDMVSINYERQVNIMFYESSESLYKDFKSNKLNMIVLDLDYFFKNKNHISKIADNFWSLNTYGTVYSQYYLIANKNLKSKGFKELKGKRLAFKDGDKSIMIWLDKNSLNKNKKSLTKTTKDITLVKKENTALLNVFFNKSDYAVITKKTWDIATELNPSIKKKIEVIEKSEKIHIPFIGLFRKSVSEPRVESFFKVSQNLRNLDGGIEIVELLKFDSLFRIKDENLKKLDSYYSDYFELKNKYK